MSKRIIVGAFVAVAVVAFVVGRASHGSGDPVSSSRRILYYVDPMHPSYHSDKPGIAPDCGMALEPVYEGDDMALRMDLPAGAVSISAEKQQLIGVRVEAVEKGGGERLVRTTGRVVPNDNRVYRLTAGTDGWVTMLNNNPEGTIVKKDDRLASFYSREFRNAEQAYLGALTSLERVKGAGAGNVEDANRFGDNALRLNEEALRALGMSEAQIKDLGKTRQLTRDIAIVSPTDGIVLARNIAPDQLFDRGTEFYRIADLSKVWIVADLFGEDAKALKPGMRVKITVRELGKTLYATVSKNPPLFDAASRTLKLRLDADNAGWMLRPDMYVDVELPTRVPAGISVPVDAVLDSGMRKIVYVQTGAGVFEPRQVETAEVFGDRVGIKSGLAEGDRVVTSGTFLLDSESRMRSTGLVNASVKHEAPASSKPMNMKKEADPDDEVKDLVCGMSTSAKGALANGHVEKFNGRTFYFCSSQCQSKFHKEPRKYADEALKTAEHQHNSGRHDD
jgi:membrane fusion protein, copper/silver efflux system